MQIGKPGSAKSAICRADAASITVRGHDLCADLMGRLTFTYLLVTGREPTLVDDIASKTRAAGGRLPGFGHPLHRPVDPRSERILALAEEQGISGRHVKLARLFPAAVERAWSKPLVMNVSMAIAAVLLDLDFPPAMVKAVPILARTAGLLAHLAEEQTNPIGFLMAAHGEDAIAYDAEP